VSFIDGDSRDQISLLRQGLRAVKAEAALSILAFNILHAMNAFGATAITTS
jgi:hypothetical protein